MVAAGIAGRLAEVVGQRSQASVARKMGISRARLSQMLAGDVPKTWLHLRALREEGYDIHQLLTGE